MQCQIYFLRLNDEQRGIVNQSGWGTDIGRAYMAATARKDRDHAAAIRSGLVELAAEVDVPEQDGQPDLHYLWAEMQNGSTPWTVRHTCHTEYPRSLSAGDIIVPEGMEPLVVAGLGVEPLRLEELQAWKSYFALESDVCLTEPIGKSS